MTKEKLIARIMRECEKDGEPVTKEEAEQIAEMEIRAFQNRHYEKIRDSAQAFYKRKKSR